jgi:YegS/Rv2252/BmrU family lipid kinase
MAHLPHFVALMDKAKMSYKVHETERPMHAYEIAKSLVHTHAVDGIVGIGGDGTFQEIAAGMVDAFPHGQKIPVPLGIFPGGSGNDFVMTAEGGKRAALRKYKINPAKAAFNFFETLQRGQTRSIDVVTANGMAFLNVGCVGLDARIVENAVQLKKRWGSRAYYAAVYKSIARHENMTLTITADGETLEGDFTLAAMCNGQYYGGGMRIAPEADLADGKISMVTVDGMSRPRTMVVFPSVLLERHTRLKELRTILCEEVQIIMAREETLCLDGNLYPPRKDYAFRVLPQALSIFA